MVPIHQPQYSSFHPGESSNLDIFTLQQILDFTKIQTTTILFNKLQSLVIDFGNDDNIRRSVRNFIYILFVTKLTAGQRKALDCYVTEINDCSSYEGFDGEEEALVFWGQYPIIQSLKEVEEFLKLLDNLRGVKIFEFLKSLNVFDDLKGFNCQLGLGKRSFETEDDLATGVSKRSRF